MFIQGGPGMQPNGGVELGGARSVRVIFNSTVPFTWVCLGDIQCNGGIEFGGV